MGLFEVDNFVASTRRRYDRGNPRDAGERHACQAAKAKPSDCENNRTAFFS